MTERRDFGPIANQMREALDRYSREELADLLTHIVRLYVIESEDRAIPEVSVPTATASLQELSFPQLILHLQMNCPHPELQGLRVSGNRVWVERRGVEIVLTAEDAATESAEEIPDSEFIEPGMRRTRPPGVAAAQGPVYAEEAAAPAVDPGFRRREPARTPGMMVEEVGRIPRPDVGLREEAQPAAPAARTPAPSAGPPSWRDELASPPSGRGRNAAPAAGAAGAKGRKEEPEDDSKDVSDRFSMLELD